MATTTLTHTGAHEMMPVRGALRTAEDTIAQLIEVTARIKDRQGRIETLVHEQRADQDVEHRLQDTLRGQLRDCHREHEQSEDAWARKVVEATKEANDRWTHRLATVESELHNQQTKHHREIAELQRDWLEAVASIRRLEAVTDLQRSAADMVIQNANAVEGFLKANPVQLTPIAPHGNAAPAPATATIPAPSTISTQPYLFTFTAKPQDADGDDAAHRGQETPSEKSPDKYDAAGGDVTPGRNSLAHERSPGESPSATPARSVSLASVGLHRPTTPESLGETARPPMPTIVSILRNADHDKVPTSTSPRRRTTTPPPARAEALPQIQRSNSISRSARKPLSAAFDYGHTDVSPRQQQQPLSQRSSRSASARSSPQRGDWNSTRVPQSWSINATGRSLSAGANEGNDSTLGLVLGLRRQDCHLLGIEVVRVIPGSAAHHAGIRPRSLLVELNGRRITSTQDVQNVLVEIKRREQLRQRVGDFQNSHVLIPFQCIDLPRTTEGRAYFDALESRTELELDDGRRLSWEGHLRLDVSRLAVGPFNQHKEQFVGSPTDLAPVSEVFTTADAYYW